jgi:hypothetical protein
VPRAFLTQLPGSTATNAEANVQKYVHEGEGRRIRESRRLYSNIDGGGVIGRLWNIDIGAGPRVLGGIHHYDSNESPCDRKSLRR